jgi:hypothetical protein
MTPEERARADAITEEIARQAKGRKEAQIPGVSRDANDAKGSSFRYAALFAFVAAAHLAGFAVYQHYSETQRAKEHAQEAEIRARAELAQAEANAAAEAARNEAERLTRLLATQEQKTRVAPASPKIEYNVFPERTKTKSQQRQPVKEETVIAASEKFSRDDHAAFAVKRAQLYFNGEYAKKLGVRQIWVTDIASDSTDYDRNWNKYITEGTVNFSYYQTGSRQIYTRSEKYQVTTHVRDGRITLESDVRAK